MQIMNKSGKDHVEKLYLETPLIESTSMSNMTRKQVYLKLENVQPSGSFKLRGISYHCKKVNLYIYFSSLSLKICGFY